MLRSSRSNSRALPASGNPAMLRLIFCAPKLKYCRKKFLENLSPTSLPISPSAWSSVAQLCALGLMVFRKISSPLALSIALTVHEGSEEHTSELQSRQYLV